VSAQHIPALVTVEEWENIPDPPGGHYELHHGELAFVTHPVRRHWDVQSRLQELLAPIYKPAGFVVGPEYGYRPLPQNEVWVADLACVRRSRHASVDKWLLGSPELAIEVKSPSNTKAELLDKAMTTLAGDGAVEFWIVDPDTRTVTVHARSGMYRYDVSQHVPLPGVDASLSVAEILDV
jgi:Uma2 family endonuclease